jgi:hypothetical protein
MTGRDVLEQYEASPDSSLSSPKHAISRGFKGSLFNGTFALNKISTTDPGAGGFFRYSTWRHEFNELENCPFSIEVKLYNTPQSDKYLVEIDILAYAVCYYDSSGGMEFKSLDEMLCGLPQNVAGQYPFAQYTALNAESLIKCDQTDKIQSSTFAETVLNENALSGCDSVSITGDLRSTLCGGTRRELSWAAAWPPTAADVFAGPIRIGPNQYSDGFGVFSFQSDYPVLDWKPWRPRGSTSTTDVYKLPRRISANGDSTQASRVAYTAPDAIDFVSLSVQM